MAKKIIEKYNDKLSSLYDDASNGEFRWTPPLELKKIIKPFLKKHLIVLDVGVGTGQTSEIFIKKGASVTGIDISQKMLDLAGSKYKFKTLIKHDITKGLPEVLKSEKFDIIVASGIFEFTKDMENILKNLLKLLESNGIIVLTYEVFGENNAYESKKTAPLGDGIKPELPKLLRFNVYRRTPEEINSLIQGLKLKIKKRKIFTAYYKSEQKIPVKYEIILTKLK